PEQLSPRLQVLHTLGLRRQRSMDTVISDRLTGLYNRKHFLRRLDEAMYRTTRYNNDVGVLLVDIDFEIPGGKLSEATANDLLPQVADFFRDRLRRSDIIARYKWSQIAILLPEINSDDCESLAKDIHRKLQSHNWKSEGHKVAVNPTVSWLLFPVENLSSSIDVMTGLEDCIMHGRGEKRHVISYMDDAGVSIRSI